MVHVQSVEAIRKVKDHADAGFTQQVLVLVRASAFLPSASICIDLKVGNG